MAVKWTLIVLAVLAAAAAALRLYGDSRWNGLTRALTARLDAARTAPQPGRFDARELNGLPAPVQRYFHAVLQDGAALVAAVNVEHRGSFNLSESGEQWKPFHSEQRVVMRRPGFVWNGHITVLPGLPVHVHDAYIAGDGVLHPAVIGVFSLADLRGGGDIAQGELMRWLAEAPWYPTALLPSQGVHWEAVDERAARATLSDGAVMVSLLFTFNADGLIDAVRADARGRTVGGNIVMTPWEGRWSDYQLRDGMRVPMRGDVAWLLPQGRQIYWRGTIERLRYEFAG